jgi:hypothetical protein
MGPAESGQLGVKSGFKVALRRVVSPKTLQFVRGRWWYLSSYFPRTVTSLAIKRTAEVRGFGVVEGRSSLTKQLQSVNVLAPTKACRVMTKYGSDKGRLHNYTTVYSALFKERYNQPLRIFELGMGTNNPDVPSNMGLFGAPGASHRGWRELFPHALVYGADIDRRILFQEDRIKTFYCNQLEPSSIHELWSQPELQGGVDIIIEDALHTFEANDIFLQASLGQLRPGGIFVTEDIESSDVERWYHRLESFYAKQYPAYEFAFVVMPDIANQGYHMLVARRTAD